MDKPIKMMIYNSDSLNSTLIIFVPESIYRFRLHSNYQYINLSILFVVNYSISQNI